MARAVLGLGAPLAMAAAFAVQDSGAGFVDASPWKRSVSCVPRRASTVCTDTRGASIVGFAFAHVLAFNVLSG
ncbi:hypothetical protein [Streptomyces sp. NPDC002463]|uniref:hypothetical protein n=1 Tax=Streptomyces sp. NPDC002463 TaxID=3364645 RepID=UPI0036B4EA22